MVDRSCSNSLHTSTALVVDDCRFVTERVARVLAGRGFACTVADDGFRALALARARQFDLLVIAVELPFIDGVSLLRQLRGDPNHCDAPLLMLASDLEDLEHDRQHALALGASAYLSKPLRLPVLEQTLDLLVRARR